MVVGEKLELLADQDRRRRHAQRDVPGGPAGRVDDRHALLRAVDGVALAAAVDRDAGERAGAHVGALDGGRRHDRVAAGARDQPAAEQPRLGVGAAHVVDRDVLQLGQRAAVVGVVEDRRDHLAPAGDLRPGQVGHDLAVLRDQRAERVERLGEPRRVGDEPRGQRAQRAEHRAARSRAAPSHSRNTRQVGQQQAARPCWRGRRRRPGPSRRTTSQQTIALPPSCIGEQNTLGVGLHLGRVAAAADDQRPAGPRVARDRRSACAISSAIAGSSA